MWLLLSIHHKSLSTCSALLNAVVYYQQEGRICIEFIKDCGTYSWPLLYAAVPLVSGSCWYPPSYDAVRLLRRSLVVRLQQHRNEHLASS